MEVLRVRPICSNKKGNLLEIYFTVHLFKSKQGNITIQVQLLNDSNLYKYQQRLFLTLSLVVFWIVVEGGLQVIPI